MARPSKYEEKFAKQAEKMCRLGATDADLADFFEISISTLNLWKAENHEFSSSIKIGKEPCDDRVERSLYHRACGYSHEDTDIRVIDGQIVKTTITKHYPPDPASCIFWLRNRKKLEWRAAPEPDDDNYVQPVKIEVSVVNASAD